MRNVARLLVLVGLLAFVGGCGGDDSEESAAMPATTPEAAADQAEPAKAEEGKESEAKDDGAEAKDGTEVVLGDSKFGEMLYDAGDQAIYVFERDSAGTSSCYGECAAAWPPVLTSGAPVAGKGIDKGLLGTIERDDGATQVTYGGRPLYYYAHEDPGEVLCHNVDLNGGFWWVVGADAEPLA
jgi:predicted lipoprotein with Yx(FWY)xxD motif